MLYTYFWCHFMKIDNFIGFNPIKYVKLFQLFIVQKLRIFTSMTKNHFEVFNMTKSIFVVFSCFCFLRRSFFKKALTCKLRRARFYFLRAYEMQAGDCVLIFEWRTYDYNKRCQLYHQLNILAQTKDIWATKFELHWRLWQNVHNWIV